MPPPLDIEASARRAGGHRWVEQRLFEVLGAWSAELGDDRAAALVGAHSRIHGSHAELWASCLPTLPHLDPSSVTVPPSPALAAVVAAVAAGREPPRSAGDGRPDPPSDVDPAEAALAAAAHELAAAADGARDGDGDDRMVERLVGVYRVLLPRLVTAYERRRSEASPVCDGPVLRVLDVVVAAAGASWCEGEAVLQRLLGTPEALARAARQQAAVEASLVAAGGIP